MSDTLPHLRPGAKQRRVVCAANRIVVNWPAPGRTETYMVCGPRHYDATMHTLINAHRLAGWGEKQWQTAEQGFVDQWGTFMDRREAFVVAKAAGQILYGPHLPGDELDSSDLY